jgi:NTP pyrophosphatase (non-canonical NTP hydrolase)
MTKLDIREKPWEDGTPGFEVFDTEYPEATGSWSSTFEAAEADLKLLNKQIRSHIPFQEIVERAHVDACLAGWHDPDVQVEKGTRLMLIVSEVAEAMEGERRDLMDDKLPDRKMAEVELADACIRIFDYVGKYRYDLLGAILEKMEYNRVREDHKREVRERAGGKKW